MEAVEEAFNKDEVMETDLGQEDTEMVEEMVEEEMTEEVVVVAVAKIFAMNIEIKDTADSVTDASSLMIWEAVAAVATVVEEVAVAEEKVAAVEVLAEATLEEITLSHKLPMANQSNCISTTIN